MKFFDTFIFSLTKLLAIFILISCLLAKFELIPITVLSHQMVLLHILMIIGYRKFKPFAFLLIFVLPYTLVAYWHFNNPLFPLNLGGKLDFDNEKYQNGVFVILSIFWSVFALILPIVRNPIVLKDNFKFCNKPQLFYVILSIQLLILLFGRTGNTIFESGGYASEGSNTENLGGTAIFEYFLVLYPIAYYFSGKNKLKLLLLLLIGGVFGLKALMLGGRVEMLQCMLLIYILHIDNRKTSLFKLLLIALPFIIFFIAFGYFRSSPDLKISELYLLLKDNLNIAVYSFFANQIDVYYSSSRLYGFCTDDILTFFDRLFIFFNNIFAIIVPYSWLPPSANIAGYKQDVYHSGGGGLFPVFFFVYLSYLGVILLAIAVGSVFRRTIKKAQKVSVYFLVYVVMILSTFPRWYAYSPNVIYKFCLYSVIVLFAFRFLLRLKEKRKVAHVLVKVDGSE